MKLNPYDPPRAGLQWPGQAPSDDELAAYVGPNSDRYLAQWAFLREGTAKLAGFNWPAFLVSPFWLAYRRLYWESAAIIVLLALSIPAEALLVVHGVLTPLGASIFFNVVLLLLYGFIGVAANPWYFYKASQDILARRSAGDPDLAAISDAGGVRPAAAWFAVFVSLGLVFTASELSAGI